MAEQTKASLPKDVAEKYKLSNKLSPGVYDIPGFGMVDLTTITMKQADRLAAKTSHLVLKKKAGVQPGEGPA